MSTQPVCLLKPTIYQEKEKLESKSDSKIDVSSTDQKNYALYPEEDTRLNLYELEGCDELKKDCAQIQKQAMSVLCFVKKELLHYNKETYSYSLNESIKSFGEAKQLISKEKFYFEPYLGHATAFLIGKRIALTAGHCVVNTDTGQLDATKIKSTFLVFDYMAKRELNKGDIPYKDFEFQKDQVYEMVDVIAHRRIKTGYASEWQDWAVILLDRDVEGRDSLELDFSIAANLQEPIYYLGHPSGLPLKVTYGGKVQIINYRYLETNTPSCGGASGSAALSQKTGKLLGIVCEGHEDFECSPLDSTKKQRHRPTLKEIQRKGYNRCHSIRDLSFLKAFFSSLEIPKNLIYSDLPKLAKGLSLEILCHQQGVAHRSTKDIEDGEFDAENMDPKHQCSSCSKPVDLRHISSVRLADCQYHIIARKGSETINQIFQLCSTAQGFRMNIQFWDQFKLHITRVPEMQKVSTTNPQA